jgi:hypothetical protein
MMWKRLLNLKRDNPFPAALIQNFDYPRSVYAQLLGNLLLCHFSLVIIPGHTDMQFGVTVIVSSHSSFSIKPNWFILQMFITCQ